MTTSDSDPREPGATARAVARVLLPLYAVTLALIALWPVPVDSQAGPFLRAVERAVPALTYERVEFAANIALFIPLGMLLMLMLRRRYLIVPIALVVTVLIEASQGLLLDRRTPSMFDIIANLTGACIGMLLVAVFERRRERDAADTVAQADAEAQTWAALGLSPPSRD